MKNRLASSPHFWAMSLLMGITSIGSMIIYGQVHRKITGKNDVFFSE